MSLVLGLHGAFTLGSHEASCTLIRDGEVLGIFEEERYTRIKGGHGILPHLCIKAALKQCAVKWEEIDLIVVPGITYPKHEERWRDYLTWKFGANCPRIDVIHHQDAHLYCGRYHAHLEDPLVVSLDSRGDGACGAVMYATEARGVKRYLPAENSLGLFYTMMTNLIGFEDGDEYKLMGLAPYGQPRIDLSDVLQSDVNGWRLNPLYVNSSARSPFERQYSAALLDHVGLRSPDIARHPSREDLAASTQALFEDRLLAFLDSLPRKDTLVLAGGVALNCAATGKLLGKYKRVAIPPNCSDRGLSLGCAYWGAELCGDHPQPLKTALQGSRYEADEIREELEKNGVSFRVANDPAAAAAELLASGRIIGWHSGRSECGARTLGARSILADPRRPEMRDSVNAKIKYREKFRPFAPAILESEADAHFESMGKGSPYMTFAIPAKGEALTWATTHIDGTARVQTVDEDSAFGHLLTEFCNRTGCPALLNTSFNLKGQPIVETPRDALATFFSCGLDALVMGNFIVEKRS